MKYMNSLIHSTWFSAELSSALGHKAVIEVLKRIRKNSNLNEGDQISLHTQKDVVSLMPYMIPRHQSVLLLRSLSLNHNDRSVVSCAVVLLTWMLLSGQRSGRSITIDVVLSL